jgi:hypothetical protein
MTTMTIDQTAYSTTVAKFSDIIMRATAAQVEQASVWYFEAESVAREVAANMTLELDRAACIVSAFSPRERWSVNVRKALAYSVGLPVAGLPNNVTMADASLVHGFDALKGLKTNAFARAIAGDTDALGPTHPTRRNTISLPMPCEMQRNCSGCHRVPLRLLSGSS